MDPNSQVNIVHSEILEQTPNLVYFLDIYQKKGLSDKFSNYYDDEQIYTEYERYFETIDFRPEVEESLEKDHIKKLTAAFYKFAKCSKQSFIDFTTRNSNYRQLALHIKEQFDLFFTYNKQTQKQQDNSTIQFFETLPGKNPKNWPIKLDQFISSLRSLKFNALFYRPFKLNFNFQEQIEEKHNECLHLINKNIISEEQFDFFVKILEAELLVYFLRGSFYRVFQNCLKLINLESQLTEGRKNKLCQALKRILAPILKEIIYDTDKPLKDFYPKGEQCISSFALSDIKVYDFNIQDSYSVTTDGFYIYEAVASSSLIHLYKIGTGNGETEAGIIYNENAFPSINQRCSILYLEGKLYLKTQIDQTGIFEIDILSTENLTKTSSISLNLKEYFQNPHLNQYNKHFQLFTDGQFLYTILMNIKFIKPPVKKEEPKKEEVKKDEIKKEEVKKEEIKKEEVKKDEIKKEEVKKDEIKNEVVKKEEVQKDEIEYIQKVENETKQFTKEEEIDYVDKMLKSLDNLQKQQNNKNDIIQNFDSLIQNNQKDNESKEEKKEIDLQKMYSKVENVQLIKLSNIKNINEEQKNEKEDQNSQDQISLENQQNELISILKNQIIKQSESQKQSEKDDISKEDDSDSEIKNNQPIKSSSKFVYKYDEFDNEVFNKWTSSTFGSMLKPHQNQLFDNKRQSYNQQAESSNLLKSDTNKQIDSCKTLLQEIQQKICQNNEGTFDKLNKMDTLMNLLNKKAQLGVFNLPRLYEQKGNDQKNVDNELKARRIPLFRKRDDEDILKPLPKLERNQIFGIDRVKEIEKKILERISRIEKNLGTTDINFNELNPNFMSNDFASMEFPLENEFFIDPRLAHLPNQEEIDDLETINKIKEGQQFGRKKQPKKTFISELEKQTVEGERNIIEFYLIKFDINSNTLIQNENILNPQEQQLVTNLEESFNNMFSNFECSKALQKSGWNLDQAALLLVEENHNQKNSELSPVSEVLIYQTECKNTDLRQTKALKVINVVPKSLITQNDIAGTQWFVKNRLLLKSSGTLFSTQQADECIADPSELEGENPNILDYRRNSKIYDLLENLQIRPEILDHLVETLKEDYHDKDLQQLFLSRHSSQTVECQFKIRTTFLKTYSNKLLINQTNRKIGFDHINQSFYVINFEKLQNANYNIIKQKYTFYGDNQKEASQLKKIGNNQNSSKSFIFFAEVFKASSFLEFIHKLLEFIAYFNTIRPFCQNRINNWVYSYGEEIKNLQEKDKNKIKRVKTSASSKIKLLISLANQKKNSLERFVKKMDEKNLFELNSVYFLCCKGDIRTFEILNQLLMLNTNQNSITYQTATKLLFVWTFYIDRLHNLEEIKKITKLLLQLIPIYQKDSVLQQIVTKIFYIISQDQQSFSSMIDNFIKNNSQLINLLLDEAFCENIYIFNKFPYNSSSILTSKNENDRSYKTIEHHPIKDLRRAFYKFFFIKGKLSPYLDQLIQIEEAINSKTIIRSIRNLFELQFIRNEQKVKKGKLTIIDSRIQAFDAFIWLVDFLDKTTNLNLTPSSNSDLQIEIFRLMIFISGIVLNNFLKRSLNLDSPTKKFQIILKRSCEFLKQEGFDIDSIQKKNQIKSKREGINQSEYYILETLHPIERGKQITFRKISSPDTLGFLIEFDKRCQDEEGTDIFTLSSYYNPEKKYTSTNAPDSIITKHINIVSKKGFKKPVLMIGDQLETNFTTSNLAKNNSKSLNQWGFKLIIRPIYAWNLKLKSKNRQFQYLSVSTWAIHSFSVALRQLIEIFIKGFSINQKEIKVEKFLEWKIFHRGLVSLNKSKFLKTDGGKLVLDLNKPKVKLPTSLESEGSKTIPDHKSLGDEYDVSELNRLAIGKDIIVQKLIQVVTELGPIKPTMAREKTRPLFLKEHQAYWEEVESQIIMSYLYHNNILKLFAYNSNQDLPIFISQANIKEQLKLIAKKKNDILEHMLNEVQIEREFQNAITDVFEIILTYHKQINQKIIEAPKSVSVQQETVKKIPNEEIKIKQKVLDAINRRDKNKKKKKIEQKITVKNNEIQQQDDKSEKETNEQISNDDFNSLIKNTNVQNDLKKLLQSRFDGVSVLNKIFKRKKIEITTDSKENLIIFQQFIIQTLTEFLKINNQFTLQLILPNPYRLVAQIVNEKCSFLLKIETEKIKEEDNLIVPSFARMEKNTSYQKSSKRIIDEEEEEILKPIGLHKSLTSETRTKSERTQKKVENLQNWVENYKNWKNSMTNREEDVKSEECSPIYIVTKFLTVEEPIDIKTLQSVITKATQRACFRVVGMQHYIDFQKTINRSICFQNSDLICSSIFESGTILENVLATHSDFKIVLSELALKAACRLMKTVTKIVNQIQTLDIYEITHLQKELGQGEESFFDRTLGNIHFDLQKLNNAQIEIYTLINNAHFVEILNGIFANSLINLKLFKTLVNYHRSCISLHVFLTAVKYLSIDFQTTTILIKQCQRSNTLSLSKFAQSKANIIVEILNTLISSEIGRIKDDENINVHIFERCFDPIGVQRLVFLLKSLKSSLIRLKQNRINQISFDILQQNLYILLNYSKNSRILTLTIRCFEVICDEIKPDLFFLKDNLISRISFNEFKICKANKNLLQNKSDNLSLILHKNSFKKQEKTNKYKEENSPDMNNMMNLLKKIGSSVLNPKLLVETQTKEQELYNIYLHLGAEEDLCSLIRVFYFWEITYPTFTKKYPNNIQEFHEYIKKHGDKGSGESKKIKTLSQNQNHLLNELNQNNLRLFEGIIQNMPDVGIPNQELPIGWFLSLGESFQNLKIAKQDRNQILTKQPKRIWEMKNLTKLCFTIVECLKGLKPPANAKDQQVQRTKSVGSTFHEGFGIDILHNDIVSESIVDKVKYNSEIKTQNEQKNSEIKQNDTNENQKELVTTNLEEKIIQPLSNEIQQIQQQFLQDSKIEQEKIELEENKVNLIKKEEESNIRQDVKDKTALKLLGVLDNSSLPPEIKKELQQLAIPGVNAKELSELLIQRIEVIKDKINIKKEVCKLKEDKIIEKILTKEELKIQEDKFIQTFRLLRTLLEITKCIQVISKLLNYCGWSQLIMPTGNFEDSYDKAELLSYILNLFLHKKFGDIPTNFINDDQTIKKLIPLIKNVNSNSYTSAIQVSIVSKEISKNVTQFLNFFGRIKSIPEQYPKYANKFITVLAKGPLSLVRSNFAKILSNFIKRLIKQSPEIRQKIQELFANALSIEQSNTSNQSVQIGLLMLTTNWSSCFISGDRVKCENEDQEFKVISQPFFSGKKQTVLINENDPKGLIKKPDALLIENERECFDFTVLFPFEKEIVENIKILYETTIKLQKDNLFDRIKLVLLLKILFHITDLQNKPLSVDLKNQLITEIEELKGDQTSLFQEFVSSVESFLERKRSSSITVLEKFNPPEQHFSFELTGRKKSTKPQNISNKQIQSNHKDFSLPKSGFISSMLMSHPKTQDFKMLKHWERHIIPKILNFVKGSLNPYEIEDFFEQMRIQLRKGNDFEASEIAYVLCDQKLPNDCYLPELTYDWNTIDFEDIKIGQLVSVKIRDDKGVFAPILESFNKLNIASVLGKVIFKDSINSTINVLIGDMHGDSHFSVWVPQQAIRQIEIPIQPSSSNYPILEVKTQLNNSFLRIVRGLSQELLFADFLKQGSPIPDPYSYKILRLLLQKELRNDSLMNWQCVLGNGMNLQTENLILNKVTKRLAIDSQLVDGLLIGLQKDIDEMLIEWKENKSEFDMITRVDLELATVEKVPQNSEKLIALNTFGNENEVAGLIIEFKKDATLYKCSGVKFFADKDGTKLIEHIQTTQKQIMKKINPIVFNCQQVYYKCYFNSEALPTYMKNEGSSTLNCVVYSVPNRWNFVLFCIDSISTISAITNHFENFQKCIQLSIQLLNKFDGPNTAARFLLKSLTRNLIKIGHCFKDQNLIQIKQFILLTKPAIEEAAKNFLFYYDENSNELYSSYIQDLSEFLAVYYQLFSENCQLDKYLSPEIKKLSQLFQLADFINDQNSKPISVEIRKMLQAKLSPMGYLNRIVFINKIPKLQKIGVQKIIENNLTKSKLKVLMPELDVYIPTDSDENSVGYVVVLFEGWGVPDYEELHPNKDIVEEQNVAIERIWECENCTLQNADSEGACLVCTLPKPVNPMYVSDSKPTKQKEMDFSSKKRFSLFKESLLKDFERLTPDKRIEITLIDKQTDSGQAFLASNEFIEFLLVRITQPDFQDQLNIVCSAIYTEYKLDIKQEKGEISEEQFKNSIMNAEPDILFSQLARYGYDCWLEKTSISEFQSEKIQILNRREIERFLEFFENDLCQDSDYSIHMEPLDFRLEFKTALKGIDIHKVGAIDQLNYPESKLFFLKLLKYGHYSNLILRTTLATVLLLNEKLFQSYKLINLESEIYSQSDESRYLSIGTLLSKIREYWLSSLKNMIIKDLLSSTSLIRDENPKVIIERFTKEKDIKGQRSGTTKNEVFLQAMKQLMDVSSTMLRPVHPKGSEPFICFEIIFKGEHVMGEAGPYRQFFTDISGELQTSILEFNQDSKKLGLLIPSPNKQSDTGERKEKYVINPASRSSYYLQQYEFLGLLMGCAFRTNTFLAIDLPTMFWKKMVNQTITDEDIEEVDKGLTDLIRFIKSSSPEIFEDFIFENFTAHLSDKSTIELVPGGSEKKVTFLNRNEYIQKIKEARLKENDYQIEYIKKGFLKIVPVALLSCLSAKDLEKKVCGTTQTDFDLLKRHTSYSGGLSETHPLIVNFWSVLMSLSENDKLRFVKFCWAQERLPSTSQAYESASIRFMVKPSLYQGNQNGLLPRSDTCFFNFELPNYSTKEIMLEKILLAIHTDCDSMNAEERTDNQVANNNNHDDDKSIQNYSELSEGVEKEIQKQL